jgi:anchored repeat-type ABC transporter ATP-binding subunit
MGSSSEVPAGRLPGAAPSAPPAVALDRVRVAYGEHVVLEDISVAFPAGAMVGLIGPNGAGKSTLLKAVLGLVPLARGRIDVLGQKAAGQRRALAYVPQRGELDWGFPITVEEMVLLGRIGRSGLFRRTGAADRAAARTALERLGLWALRRRQIGELSGGQQQRVVLARALAQEGQVLLLDEPLTGVDVPTQEAILAVLTELRGEGASVVMSTHDLPLAASCCDCLCCLNHHLIAFGPPAAILTSTVLQATFGGQLIPLEGGATLLAPVSGGHDHV